ncbi:penicillin-binding protein 1C [Tabrizicola sp. DMG-N-6]|uniref:peptidoglycan glycosyltransferase n=1 Tax=Szabonella alba TaxID=2804194 RepID=A0A8K0VAL7_9RHOB|nr:penicillin-binding protein 1C [Szabonella alba]MBL4915732.1 penicillin-binding protein 1C [Szabonella alba]
MFALALALWAGGGLRDAGDRWVAATVLPPLQVATATEILARDGQLLRAYQVADGRWRLAVSVDRVDPRYLQMLIAFEDRRFRSHAGVDPLAALRAGWQAVTSRRVVSGGSTLTMQVARLLEESGTGQITGKLRQMRVALALERRLDKDQILSLYLHLAPFGGNLEGVRAATISYFGKEPQRLTPAEAALLVALPQSPETRRPDRHADHAEAARARILARAVAAGVIGADQALAAQREAVPTRRRPFPAHAPHLADRVAGPVSSGLSPHRLTIDAGLQKRLEALARDTVAAHGARLQIAMMIADHRTGEVLASVGSADYTEEARQGFVDMTRAVRSPGSLLKPLVYALAFDEGLAHPETLIDDQPMDFAGYRPQNFDRRFRGTLRVREALVESLNLPVVALTEAMGPARLMTGLRRAGVDPRLPGGGGRPGLALALGGVGVTLEEMAGLYAALAHGGVARPLRVSAGDAGAGTRVISAVAAWQIGDILAGMPPPGGGGRGIAYKTGTSYGHRDAWALGYDGRHVVGVWLGRADGTPVPGVFGADLAAPVLAQAFARIGRRIEPLPPPPSTALILSNAALPQPLQRFRPRGAAFGPDPGAPAVAFPPDGAQVELLPEGVLLRVRGGTAPFTWLADGVPVVTALRSRDALVPLTGPGFVTLSVIDANGRSARSSVRLAMP